MICEHVDVDARTLRTVLAQHPDLTVEGFRSLSDRDFGGLRHRLSSDGGIAQFQAAFELVFLCAKRPTFDRRRSTYWWKHTAEAWWRERHGQNVYVSNGALIAAALAAGFRVQRIPRSPNGFTDISPNSSVLLQESARP